MQNMGKEILMYLAGGFGIFLVLRFLRKPFKLIIRLIVSSVFGGILLMLLNTFGASFGVYLAINPVTAFLCGVLGLPGVLTLLFIRLWL